MDAAINTSTLEVTREILSLVSEIDEFKGARRVIERIGHGKSGSWRRRERRHGSLE